MFDPRVCFVPLRNHGLPLRGAAQLFRRGDYFSAPRRFCAAAGCSITAKFPRTVLLHQAFLNTAFLMRPTATVTIAPVMPPPAKLPSAVAMSNPPLLAAPPRAGIKLCRMDPPIPPPAAPGIVLTRGAEVNILQQAAGGIAANRPCHDLENKIDNGSRHIAVLLEDLRIDLFRPAQAQLRSAVNVPRKRVFR